MELLSREAILTAQDLVVERVPVPEWNCDVLVRSLTGTERDAFEEGCYIGRGKDRREHFVNLRARLVALTMVDADGRPLFTAADASALGAKNSAALDRVFAVAQRLSGLSPKDVEDLAGNSKPGQNGATTSSSPSG